jgi:TonB-dependent SusC/RagA subfamily outer membrane receptor
MISHLLSAVLRAGVLVGLAAGCASATKRQEPPAKGTVPVEGVGNTSESIEKWLEAKAPGLLVTRTPDGRLALQIRGPSSIQNSNEPLFVIDDVVVQAGAGGALTSVNPHDIESIQVLKDPADTAMYGMRGANGVIVIKTKKPGPRS